MRILHVDTGRELRGGQQQLLLLARGLRQKGHDQAIVCPEASGLEARSRQEGFRVFALPLHDPANAHGALVLRRLLAEEPFEIIHAHDGRGQTIAWMASAGTRTARVASRRVTFLPRVLASHRLKYALTCHAVIAVSQFVRGLLVRSGVPASKIEVIPDGVELPSRPASREARLEKRAALGVAASEFVVGHVGAFTPEKGQDIAIEAAMHLANLLPRARILLAGDGPLRSSPRLQARLGKAQGRVRLLGYVSDLPAFMESLDLFIMPSRAEGLGSAALIAMAHGLPVVASRAGGLPEIVEEGKTGWLVPPESPEALASAIAAAASDAKRLAELSANARENAARFSAAIMLERTEALYRRLAARRAEGLKINL